jgi:hypothetical protein
MIGMKINGIYNEILKNYNLNLLPITKILEEKEKKI